MPEQWTPIALPDLRSYIFNVVLQPSFDSLPTRPHRIEKRNHTQKMYNKHATSKDQIERHPMNSHGQAPTTSYTFIIRIYCFFKP